MKVGEFCVSFLSKYVVGCAISILYVLYEERERGIDVQVLNHNKKRRNNDDRGKIKKMKTSLCNPLLRGRIRSS